MALSVAGGLGLFAGVASGAVADTGGGSGDGSLQLIPEVIANEGISAGGSSEFPITARLFLPATEDRAMQAERSTAAIARAADELTFEPAQRTAADAFGDTRSRLFQAYAHQAIPSARRDSAAQATDVWSIVLIAAAVPLTGLAVFLGLKTASRRVSRHA